MAHQQADAAAITRVFREESGRVIAGLVRRFGDIDLAEEAVQEAFIAATQHWPTAGLPPNPGGWITTTARNRIIDRLRREALRDDRSRESAVLFQSDEPADTGAVSDDRLRLIFTCCHPALAVPSRVALTLRLLGGLETREIAAAFLVSEATMAQRIVRAKAKIKAANIPYKVPSDSELPDRVRGVLAVIYLIFNEGHRASTGGELIREDLCAEAIRLARVLVGLMPDEPEAVGLLALLVLTRSRSRARTATDGTMVALGEQDRSLWDAALIAEGHALVRACLRRNQPGPYQLQAAINAVHADAGSAEVTDWRQIVQLYDLLLALSPSPVVALNRAAAVAETDGADVALALIEALDLDAYQPYHAVRADLLRRLGRTVDAAAAYRRAADLSNNPVERDFLDRRLAALSPDSSRSNGPQ